MALPLPRVVADVGPGGGIVTARQGINALRNSEFQNDIARSNAQYAPYTNYANALSKIAYAQYSPLDIQSKIMSNPALLMAIKDNPQALAALAQNSNNIMKAMQSNGAPGNINGQILPTPQQMQGSNSMGSGILNWLAQKAGFNQNQQPSQNMLNKTPQRDNPNPTTPPFDKNGVPIPMPLRQEGQNNGVFPSPGIGGYVDMVTAKSKEPIHAAGKTFENPQGGYTSMPTESTVGANQAALVAIKRVTPQLERLAKAAAPFMTLSGMGSVWTDQAENYLMGSDKKLPSDYAKFQADLKAAPESLLKTYGLRATNETIEQMKGVIEPRIGESGEGYKNRILGTLKEIQTEQQEPAQKALSEGIDVTAKKPEIKMTRMRGIDPVDNKMKIWDVPETNVDKFIAAGFKKVK
jgi:hypothetical protein